jgi:hypothetical protein
MWPTATIGSGADAKVGQAVRLRAKVPRGVQFGEPMCMISDWRLEPWAGT